MRRTVASFGVTPNDLGFTEDVNRATGDTQVDVQFRVGTRPLIKHVQAIINLFISKRLGLRCRLQFDDGAESEDRVATAQAHQIYTASGIESIDEVRSELGLPIDKERPMPRFVNSPRLGPQSLASVIAQAGEVDPETYAPTAKGLADAVTELAAQRLGPQAPGAANAPGANTASQPATGDENGPTEDVGAVDPVSKSGVTATNWREILAMIDSLEKDGATEGVTAASGIQGVDLIGGTVEQKHKDDDEDDDDLDDLHKQAEMATALRRWRRNTDNRLKKGQAPKLFADSCLPDEVRDAVWDELQAVKSRADAAKVFKATDEAVDQWLRFRSGH